MPGPMSTARVPADRMSNVVVAAAGLLFLASAYQLLAAPSNSSPSSSSKLKSSQSSSTTDGEKAKEPATSSVHEITYATTPDMCSQPPQHLKAPQNRRMTVRAGALLKLVDIAAGVAARRHAGGSCVTISVDAVLLLKPVYLGELIHLSASVNRAWGTSMEIGVRVTKEPAPDSLEAGYGHGRQRSNRQYVSHAYLTFVAINPQALASPSRQWKAPKAHPGVNTGKTSAVNSREETSQLGRLWRYLTFNPLEKGKPPPKPVLAPIRPRTKLEARRHLLAGRRRAKRIDDAKRGEARDGVSVEVKQRVRTEVLDMEEERTRKGSAAGGGDQPSSAVASGFATPVEQTEHRQARELRALEEEFVVRAWATHEPGVAVSNGVVHVSLPGDAPFQLPETDVRAAADRLKIVLPDNVLSHTTAPAAPTSPIDKRVDIERRESLKFLSPDAAPETPTYQLDRAFSSSSSSSSSIHVSATQTTSMHIVFPEHSNSHGIIFGGKTMEWMEEVAILAARHVGRGRGWSTVAMDGLEFGVGVGVGELMILTAIVIKTYTNSCEVYVIAQAEDSSGRRRFTNDVLFTLASGASASASSSSSASIPKVRIEEEEEEDETPMEPLKYVNMDRDTALERFAAVADRRRIGRLEMRDMLVRVYGH